MKRFCERLPKIELHAHITGSCSDETLLKLSDKKSQTSDEWKQEVKTKITTPVQSMKDCFVRFGLLQQLCDNEEAIYMATYDVIHEFAADNVKYLELRTTLRNEPSTGLTKQRHLDTVLRAISDCSATDLDIIVKLILSIDRRTTLEDAKDTLQLAERAGIVGLDLSGDPAVGQIDNFLPIFTEAKTKKLGTCLHLAELKSSSIEESRQLLSIPPDRIGHGTYLHPDVGGCQTLIDTILANRIVIECCLSSNRMTGTVAEYENHHFGYWYRKNHPCIIGTDDKGVFSTTLSKEYELVASNFNLSREQLWELSERSIEYIFSDDSVKVQLKNKWHDYRSAIDFDNTVVD